MSNRQDKMAANQAEAAAFVAERRKYQLDMLEQNFKVGVALFESKKAELEPEQITEIENMMAEQRAALDKLHEQANTGA